MEDTQNVTTSNTEPQIQEVNRVSSLKRFKKYIFATLGLIVILSIFAILFSQSNKNGINTQDLEKDKIISSISPTLTQDSLPTDWNMSKPILKQASLDNTHIIEIYSTNSPEEIGKCLVTVKTIKGIEVVLDNLIEDNVIACRYGQGDFYTAFQGWASNNRLILYTFDIPGEVKIIDLNNKKSETYKFDSKQFSFIAVNKDLDKWLLMRSEVDKEMSYVVFDKKNVVLKDDIRYSGLNDTYKRVHYDALNDAFLFITRLKTKAVNENSNELIATKFDVLDAKTLFLKNILTTEPVQLGGRGCYEEEILSEPGFIIIKDNSAGCIFEDKKYYDSNNELRLDLKIK